MKWLWKKAITLLSVQYAYMLEYRAEIFLWALSNSLPIILMGVWTKAANGGNFDLSAIDFARYFIAVFLVRQLTVVWVIWEFEREVVEGSLSFYLLQPLDPVWHHVATHLGERLGRAPLVVFLLILFFCLYPQAIWQPDLGKICLFSLTCVMAFTLRFLIQYTFAMFAFWIERAVAIQQFWLLFYLFLSGMIAPLDVFPPLMQKLTLWTPFPYMMYFPAAIIVGLEVDIVQGILAILGWGLFFFIINRWLWRRGLKQYSGMGA
ncbi:MAG: ABC-2 family transporter protein [Spirulinaceae cyanobacterium]